jgi:hypothetical protein
MAGGIAMNEATSTLTSAAASEWREPTLLSSLKNPFNSTD